MKDFRSRKKEKNSLIYNPFFVIIVFIILLLIVNSAYKSYEKKRKAELEQERFNKKYETLLNRKEELLNKIKNLKTENGIKEEIKKAYNVGEKGETVIHITEPTE